MFRLRSIHHHGYSSSTFSSLELIYGIMDFLKAEIAGKRKAMDDTITPPTKYMRKGDIEKMKQEQERKEREAREQAKKEADWTKNNQNSKVRSNSLA